MQIDYAELDRLGDEIADLSAHLDAATARLLDLIREFDARAGWNNGFRSCAAWLSWRVGLAPGAAREHVRVARALGTLPRLRRAMARGELSYSKVRELTRVATRETEERLLAVGRAGTAKHVERIVRGWRRVDRKAEAREAARQHASRALHVYPDEDGTVRVRGRLAPEVGALLVHALAAAREKLYQDARADNADTAWADASAEPPTMEQVVVHVDAEVLADPDAPGQSVLEDGARVPAGTSQRLACDASRVVMRHDKDGRLLEVGARTRTIPPALRRALHHRDRGCRFPGCGVRFGQGHHSPLGPGRPDDALEPRPALSPASPRGPRRGLPGRSTARRHAPIPAAGRPAPARGSAADSGAGRSGARSPGWTRCAGPSPPRRRGLSELVGERLDVGWAIDILHPLAAAAPPVSLAVAGAEPNEDPCVLLADH